MVSCIILAVILFAAVVCEFYAFKTGVPTIASFPSARKKIVEILKEEAKEHLKGQNFTIVDLGSGGGQLCVKIADAFPQAHVIGVEISVLPWLRSVVHKYLFHIKNLEFKRLDFWSYDCSCADVIVIFLTGNILKRLGDKLRKELKSGALIVANDERLQGDWQPLDVRSTGFLNMKVYVYRQT